MTYVEVERRGGASWARLCRPERANALGPEMVQELRAWLRAVGGDPGISALVITGSGTSFCPGADIKASLALAHAPEERAAYLASGRSLMEDLSRAPVPVVAAVNGVAFAGGFELVLACDLVVAAESAVLGDLHLASGRIPAWGSSAKLMSALGPWRAAQALLLPQRFTAEQLRGFGVIADVVRDADLPAAVDRIVDGLARVEAGALRAMKALLAAQKSELLGRLSAVEWESFTAYLAGPQMQEMPWASRPQKDLDHSV
ncbi:enoyl-CoA hydratase/isomerase family protein [Arthrobacter sp. I2-34]|uniref:Enoyl-CoA hydratase/isomerase family protein n=1 Tax=Arthrobacter hankyongi TaxID=2904801 RepID=A0ABS9L9K3_9MICC|nr:enoyl-CoA hydratase/isomerase family protein [Arthrobacter hankyongi]MCG2623381.1 enoyl-CoA hydratase/isomerase family protein [Arthrobacter hankyongi]